MADASSVRTSSPSMPSSMISRGPTGQSVLTTGSPQRMASTSVIPKDSALEVTAATEPLTHSGSSGAALPISRIRSVARSSLISARRAARSGPWP